MPFIDWDEKLPWWWPREKEKNRAIPPIDRTPKLTDAQINAAFCVDDAHPMWRATMQLLDTYKDMESRSAVAATATDNALDMAARVGSWEAFDTFQQELIRRRSEGIKSGS